MEFEDQQFDGIGVSFLSHELPPKYAEAAANEIARCLAHEGVVSVCEPSEARVEQRWWSVIRRHGFKGLYFKTLARAVHKPFLQAWLKWG
ncbi:MAG: hypothetical protein AB8B48_02945 [Pseudomonadales bacterium]